MQPRDRTTPPVLAKKTRFHRPLIVLRPCIEPLTPFYSAIFAFCGDDVPWREL
jgi:hypothetical protein